VNLAFILVQRNKAFNQLIKISKIRNEEVRLVHPIWNDYPVIQSALSDVKKIIKEDLRISHPQVKEKINEYLDAPGKYVRAGLTLLFAQAVDGQIKEAKLYFAAGVEVLHLATLIHDDVIDEADSRRGIASIHKSFSNRIAIYAGDYLLAYSNRLMAKGLEAMGALREEKDRPFDERIIERILAGELAQLLNQYEYSMTMKSYLKQIKGKTAFLFALACQLGAANLPANQKNIRYAFNIGQAIGMAFQLSDDLLDYQVSKEAMGKPSLQDVQNGIYTAPLLLAMREDASLLSLLKSQEKGSWTESKLQELQSKVGASKAYRRTQELILNYLKKSQKFLIKMELVKPMDLDDFLQDLMERKF
jgi:heptaprenyl diphosphate synthase